MKKNTLALTLVTAMMTTGCGSLGTIAPTQEYQAVMASRDAAIAQLSSTPSCCANFADLPYQDLAVKADLVVPVDAKAPIFNFAEGKSFFVAYRLPANSGDLKITVAGIAEKSLFNPKAVLLDGSFKPTREIGQDIFTYQSARMLSADRVEATFTVDRSRPGNMGNEHYLVIYTEAARLNETTTILNPDKQASEALGVVYHGGQDLKIPHSPWGVLTLAVEDVGVSKGGENYYRPNYVESATGTIAEVSTPKSVAVIPMEKPAETVAVIREATISAETERYFLQQIESAVAAGQLDRAMQLVREAEAVGSTKARPSFMSAINKIQ